MNTDKATNAPSAPGWVKAFGIVALVLVGAFVVLHLSGKSPGGHMPAATTVNESAPQEPVR